MPRDRQVQVSELDAWRRLAADAELVAAAAATDAVDVAAVERLRRNRDPAVVAAALSLADARRRLEPKFPGEAHTLWADRAAAEQATSGRVAEWKARRFRARIEGSPPRDGIVIEDRCCGMGGDARSLARVAATLALDRREDRAWMAGRNAACETLVADAIEEPLRGAYLHIDPARRDEAGGVRHLRLDRHEPPVDRCLACAGAARGGAVKLSPGLPLPLPGACNAEIELISDDGTLVQAVVWCGILAEHPGGRRATRLPDGVSLVGDALETTPIASAAGRYLHVADPALERSGLIGSLARTHGLWERAAGLGILEGAAAVPDPWLTVYEVLARIRPRPAEVTRALRAAGADRARVRTRGGSADADAWTRRLRQGSGRELDVFLLRVGERLEAIVAQPLEQLK